MAEAAVLVLLTVFKVRFLTRRALLVRPDEFAALGAGEVGVVEATAHHIVPERQGFSDPAQPAVQHALGSFWHWASPWVDCTLWKPINRVRLEL